MARLSSLNRDANQKADKRGIRVGDHWYHSTFLDDPDGEKLIVQMIVVKGVGEQYISCSKVHPVNRVSGYLEKVPAAVFVREYRQEARQAKAVLVDALRIEVDRVLGQLAQARRRYDTAASLYEKGQ